MNRTTSGARRCGRLQNLVQLAEFGIVHMRSRAGELKAADLWTGDSIIDVVKQRNEYACFVQQIFELPIQSLARAWTAFRTRFVENSICFHGREIIAIES